MAHQPYSCPPLKGPFTLFSNRANARDDFIMQTYDGIKVGRYLYQPTREGSRGLVLVTGVPKPFPPQPEKYRVGPPPRWTYAWPPVAPYLPRPWYDFDIKIWKRYYDSTIIKVMQHNLLTYDSHVDQWAKCWNVFARLGFLPLDWFEKKLVDALYRTQPLHSEPKQIMDLMLPLLERAWHLSPQIGEYRDIQITTHMKAVFMDSFREVLRDVDKWSKYIPIHTDGTDAHVMEMRMVYKQMYENSEFKDKDWFKQGPNLPNGGVLPNGDKYVCSKCNIEGHRAGDGYWCPASSGMWGKKPRWVKDLEKHNGQISQQNRGARDKETRRKRQKELHEAKDKHKAVSHSYPYGRRNSPPPRKRERSVSPRYRYRQEERRSVRRRQHRERRTDNRSPVRRRDSYSSDSSDSDSESSGSDSGSSE